MRDVIEEQLKKKAKADDGLSQSELQTESNFLSDDNLDDKFSKKMAMLKQGNSGGQKRAEYMDADNFG